MANKPPSAGGVKEDDAGDIPPTIQKETSVVNGFVKKLFDNRRIVVGDEEKFLAGIFPPGGLGENMPRGNFDDVSDDETVVIEQAQET